MSTPLLSLQDFSAQRRGRALFAPVSFSLQAGEALILKGANGSGKTSLLRSLAGLLPGLLKGVTPALEDALYPGHVLYLGHANALSPALTVREHLHFWADFYGAGKRELGGILQRIGLEAKADTRSHALSQGQKRRLAFARLLLQNATLWLLDEPQAGLDADGYTLLLQLIAEKRASGGAVLIASHEKLDIAGAQFLELAPAGAA